MPLAFNGRHLQDAMHIKIMEAGLIQLLKDLLPRDSLIKKRLKPKTHNWEAVMKNVLGDRYVEPTTRIGDDRRR